MIWRFENALPYRDSSSDLSVVEHRALETVTNADKKQPENSTETREVYLMMNRICAISYSADVKAMFEF
jgi:hypothetical protein